MMTENVCKSLRFNTMSAITKRFGRIGEREGRAPNSLIFSRFPRSPSLSPTYSASHCSFESKWRRRLPLAQRGFWSRYNKKGMAMMACRVAKKAIYPQHPTSSYKLFCVTVLVFKYVSTQFWPFNLQQ